MPFALDLSPSYRNDVCLAKLVVTDSRHVRADSAKRKCATNPI
jgi:hypothetical protein